MSTRLSGLLVIGLAVALILLAGCSSNASISLTGDTPTPTANSVTPVAMGQQAWCGDWGISIGSVKRMSTVRGAPAGKGKRLLVIKFDLRNGGTKEAPVVASDFTLNDETNAQYDPVIFPGNAYVSNNSETIGAGTKESLAIVYRVPRASGPFIWRFAGSGQSSQAKPAVLAVP